MRKQELWNEVHVDCRGFFFFFFPPRDFLVQVLVSDKLENLSLDHDEVSTPGLKEVV